MLTKNRPPQEKQNRLNWSSVIIFTGYLAALATWFFAINSSDSQAFWATPLLIQLSWVYSLPFSIGLGLLLGRLYSRRTTKIRGGSFLPSPKRELFFFFTCYIIISTTLHMGLAPLYRPFATESVEVTVNIKSTNSYGTRGSLFNKRCGIRSLLQQQSNSATTEYQGYTRYLHCLEASIKTGDALRIFAKQGTMGVFIEDYTVGDGSPGNK